MEQLLDDVDLEFFQNDMEDVLMDTDDLSLAWAEACSTESQEDMRTQPFPAEYGASSLLSTPITHFHAHLGAGPQLQRILSRGDPHPSKTVGPVVELFGCDFLLTHSTGLEMWNRFFMLARKELMLLEEIGQDLPSSFPTKAADILTFMDTLESFVYRHLHRASPSTEDRSTLTAALAEHLASCISLLLTTLSPLEEYVARATEALNPGQTRGYSQESLLALHIHIRWALLSLLFAAGSLMQDLLSSCVRHVLEELLCVGVVVFRSWEKRPGGASSPGIPFPYECVLELWCLLVGLCDRMAEEGSGKCFWKTLSDIMSQSSSDPGQGDCVADGPLSAVEPPLTAAFWWWIVDWTAQLYRYDSTGSLTSSAQGMWAEDWQLVREIQLVKVLEETCSRNTLAFSIASLKHLSSLWSPNLDVVLWFWPAVKKTMSDCPLPKLGRHLEGLFVSPQELASFVARLCDGKGGGATDHSLFMQFTALLCSVLMKLPLSGDVRKKVDEEVLSTLKNEDLLQLSNVGLGNFILFHLSLVCVNVPEDVGDLLLCQLASLRPSQPSCQHSSQVWAVLVALLYLLLQKRRLADPVVGRVARLLVELAATCSSAVGHVSGPLLSAVEVVMRGVLELYRQTVFPISSAHVALFSEPLCQCIRSLVGRGRLEAVLEWVRSVVVAVGQHCVRLKEGEGGAEERLRIQESHSVLFRHVLPILSAQAQSPLPPAQLMGCATELASLCNRKPEQSLSSGDSPAYLQLVVEEFAFNDSVAPSFCADFLVNLLKGEGQKAWLSTEHAQLRVLHSWFRCLVQMHHPPGAGQQVQRLTQCVSSLPIVVRLIAASGEVNTSHLHPLHLLRELVTAINEEMVKSLSLAEKTAWSQKGAVIFGDLMKSMEPGLSGDFPPKAMEMCYKVSGCLVRNCPRLIYRRSESRCLLPRLVDQLLVPVSNPHRPALSNASSNVKRSLHHFIWGLLQLDPHHDEFIKRKIKQIFGKYFLAYCQHAQPSPLVKRSDNPFLTLLEPCFEDPPNKEDLNVLLFVLELIAVQQLKTPQQQLSNLSPVLTFLHTVFSQIRNSEALARCTLVMLHSLLTCLRACHLQPSTPQVDQASKLGLDVVRLLLGACDQAEGLVQNSELVNIMGNYVESHMNNNAMAVFKPIQALIPFASELVSDFQPVAWDLVERAEMSRGRRKDMFLREAYQSLVGAISLHQK